jgi:hypothetical protein
MKNYSKLKIIIGLSLAILLVFPLSAAAQTTATGVVCQLEQPCQSGDYTVKVSFDRTDFNTTDEFTVTVERLDNPAQDWKLEAQVVPQKGTSAVAVAPKSGKSSYETGDRVKRQLKVDFPIAGNWNVLLTFQNEAGKSSIRIPIKVTPPPLIPFWLAWTIALTPIIGFVGFFIGQWRMVVRRKRAEQLALNYSYTPVPEPEPSTKS